MTIVILATDSVCVLEQQRLQIHRQATTDCNSVCVNRRTKIPADRAPKNEPN